MSDERRRIIYELLVEAKKSAGETKQLKQEVDLLGNVVARAKTAMIGLATALTLKELISDAIAANDEIQRLASSLKVLGLQGAQLKQAVEGIQDIAVATGQPLQSVAQAYKDLTDVSETLGLTQRDVAELTQAATQAMVAQGGSAEQAAQQLSTLTFAIEKGSVTGRELKGVLKDNEVLQQAFEQALGKSTSELLKMADAGKIGADEMRKVLEVYKELGQQQDVPATLDNTKTAVTNLASAFGAALVDALGFNTAMRELRDLLPETAEGARNLARVTAGFLKGGMIGAVREAAQIEEEQKQARIKALDEANKAFEARMAPMTPEDWETEFANLLPAAQIRAMGGLSRHEREPIDIEQRQQAEERRQLALQRWLSTQRMLIQEQIELDRQRLEIPEQELLIMGDMNDALSDRATLEQQMHDANTKNLENYKAVIPQLEIASEQLITAKDAAQVFAHSMTQLFSGGIHNAREFFRVVLEGFAEIMLQKSLMQASGFLFGEAKGDAFNRGVVQAFARGGIVGGPTMFGMTGGRAGLMGEDGPEGILPLKRGRDGKLGVGAALPSIHLVNNTGTAASAHVTGTAERMNIVLEAAELGRSLALEEVNRSLRSGYGPTAQSVQRTYGLRRRG